MAYPDVQKTLDLLGRKAKDKITGLTGVVVSISHDLFGCVQATLHTGVDKDGKHMEQFWYDVSRLEVLDEPRVMTPPEVSNTPPSSYDKGPAAKPSFDHKA